MIRNDVIDLLSIVQSVDHRKVGEVEIETWRQIIGHLERDQCLDAILAHREQRPGVWLEPGHVVQHVERERIRHTRPADRETPPAGEPSPLEQASTAESRAAFMAEIRQIIATGRGRHKARA